MFSIFAVLKPKEWFRRPPGIARRTICQDAIRIGSCKNYIEDDVIEGVRLDTPCEIMRPEVLGRLIRYGIIENFSELKRHRCYETWHSYRPRITSPVSGRKYIRNRMLPKSLKKTLMRCYSFENNSTVYWFIDDNITATGVSGEALYRYFPPGSHSVKCLDSGAKMSSVFFENREM